MCSCSFVNIFVVTIFASYDFIALEVRALKDSFACLVCKLHLKLLQIKKKKEISLDTRSLELPLDTLSWMGEGRGEANLSPNSVINYNSL